METRLYKIQVTGRVQGVGFRHSARSNARFLGLKGFVKNLPNGDVYIEAEGNKDKLDEFVSWCRKGPGFGFVERVSFDIGDVRGFEGFRVEF
jgi:acylphosphatase